MRLSLRGRLLVAYVAPATVALGVLILLSYQLARRSLEASLGDRLISVAQAAVVNLRPADLAFVEPGDEESRTYQRVRARLEALRDATGVRRIVVFSPSGQALFDSDGVYPIGTRIPDLKRDRLEVQRTVEGTPTASSVLFTGKDGQMYKSGYAPVMHEGRVVAVVLVDGSAAFFDALDTLSQSQLALAAVMLLGIGGVSFFFSQTLARPIRDLADAAARIGEGDLATPVVVAARSDEIGRLSRALEQMREALEARDRQLQMMLGGIAHEVRNPLGGIELFSGLLLEEMSEEDEEKRGYVERIQKELQHLARLVEEFLDFARERELELSPIEGRELLEELAVLLGSDAGKRCVVLSIEADDVTFHADDSLVRRAMLNLIRNSIQASPDAGTVRLHASREDTEVLLVVEDEGKGVEPDQRERIFEPFFTTKQKGSGLGLALVQKTALVHGGTVRVVEGASGGARFELRLPLEPPTRAGSP